uniref:Putative secreted protein n=1 Tax=Anopheles marajoara TaxID=58244 RepID=A0A2M4C7Z0_9DIPT
MLLLLLLLLHSNARDPSSAPGGKSLAHWLGNKKLTNRGGGGNHRKTLRRSSSLRTHRQTHNRDHTGHFLGVSRRSLPFTKNENQSLDRQCVVSGQADKPQRTIGRNRWARDN